MSATVTQLRTRKPTGRPSWPLILLAGEAKTGKTWRLAEFTGDERVGRAFLLDLGEGCADEYGAVPGADFEIVDHDGTWVDIIEQVEAVREVARASLAAGEPPVVLGVDSMTSEWAMLSLWTDKRARRSKSNKAVLAADPDAEIDITSNYWNDANSRHNRLMNILKTFPGIVVMTTLETEKTQFGANGRPIQGAPKMARPDGQKRLTADATVWVRLSHDAPPTIVGIRSVTGPNIVPGIDRAEPWPDFTLGKLVFEHLGLTAEKAQVRNTPVLDADQVAPGEEVEVPPANGQGDRGRPGNGARPAPPGRQRRDAIAVVTELRSLASRGFESLLAADTAAKAETVAKYAATCEAKDIDVSGLLGGANQRVRDALGLEQERVVSLARLAHAVDAHWRQHDRSPATAPAEAPAADAPAADTEESAA